MWQAMGKLWFTFLHLPSHRLERPTSTKGSVSTKRLHLRRDGMEVPAWAAQVSLLMTSCRRDVLLDPLKTLVSPLTSPLIKGDLRLSSLPGYDFIFLFNEDKNYDHKCQEQDISASNLQAVHKVPAILWQSESFLHGDRGRHGNSSVWLQALSSGAELRTQPVLFRWETPSSCEEMGT